MKKLYNLAPLKQWIDCKPLTGRPYTRHQLGPQDLVRVVPYILLHLSAFAVFWVGWSWFAISAAAAAYFVRMFAITAFYHRYFAHRAFKTSRIGQFIFAIIGSTAMQRGPLWWAAHHRFHHRHSDMPHDPHSPHQSSFVWSHILWFIQGRQFATKEALVKDWKAFPELVALDRFDTLIPIIFGVGVFGIGSFCAAIFPELHTSGPQLFVWVFVISTLALHHGTFTVNSLAHMWGSQRFPSRDQSRNNFWIALITLGEGWHNNHHHYPISARQGFRWWEIDITYYLLVIMKWCGIIWDLQPVPKRLRGER